MANTINADNGVSSGSAGLKSSSDGTGILALQTNGTTAVTVDASQNVGIGTASPRSKLSVTNGTENTSGDAPQEAIITGANQTITSGLGILTVQSNTAIAADVGATIALGGRIRSTGTTTDASNFAVVKGAKENATSDNSAGYFAISTKPNGVAPVERMRIDSSGNVGIGTSSPGRKLSLKGSDLWQKFEETSGSGRSWLIGTGTATNFRIYDETAAVDRMTLRSSDGVVFFPGVYATTNAAAANVYVGSDGALLRSTSSLKYKKDVQDATHGLADVLKLRSVTYKGKAESNGDTVFGGFIAEEIDALGLTEFVQYADDGSPDALAYGNMVSLLAKAIQEQQALITALTARIEALEAK